MKATTEFDEWAKRFESREYGVKPRVLPAKCIYPVNEGPHKVTCLEEATERSPDGYPVCYIHGGMAIRPAWRGYVKGA